MVKLAEPRSKKKYNLVPRGKALYEDGSRFGTKMLEKMGWTKGKGLGAREEGSTDFVHVRYKNDAEGLGYEARDDQWTQHDETFNSLLMSLSANTESKPCGDSVPNAVAENFGLGIIENGNTNSSSLKAKISGQSLEERSKQSRARVHYKKFTKGKDLSQYSEQELANIFGKKSIENTEINENFQVKGFIGNDLEKFQSSTLSVNDYFKQKIEKLKKKETKNVNEKEFSIENGNQALGKIIKESTEKLKKKKQESADNKTVAMEIEKNHYIENIKLEKQRKKEENVEKEFMQLTSIDQEKKNSKKKESLRVIETNAELDLALEITNEERKKKTKTKIQNNSENAEVNTENKTELTIKDSDQQKAKNIKENYIPDVEKKAIKRERANSTNEEKLKNKKVKLGNPTDIRENILLKLENVEENVSAEKLTPEQILEELESRQVFKISNCVAEQFRFADLSQFKGANIADIRGYSIAANVKLNVEKKKKDQEIIVRMWTSAINQYDHEQYSKNPYQHYMQLAREARQKNEKQPRFETHKFSKRNAFRVVTI